MFSLPFGASGSVPGFVRVAVALWRILCRLALVPSTLFFDDFTSITYASDASSAEATVHLLFRILGWRLALTGDKAQSYSALFQSLGVIFCLHPGVDSAVTVSNTESRRMEVSAWCLSKLREDSATPKECDSSPLASAGLQSRCLAARQLPLCGLFCVQAGSPGPTVLGHCRQSCGLPFVGFSAAFRRLRPGSGLSKRSANYTCSQTVLLREARLP